MNEKIFISYSRKDIQKATEIKRDIENLTSVKCWMDMDGIETGSQFEDVIIKAIDNSEIVVFIISESSMRSEWTRREVRYAYNRGKKVAPITIDDSPLQGWFLFNFSEIDVINYNNSAQRDKFYRNIGEWCGVDSIHPCPDCKTKINNVWLTRDKQYIYIHINFNISGYKDVLCWFQLAIVFDNGVKWYPLVFRDGYWANMSIQRDPSTSARGQFIPPYDNTEGQDFIMYFIPNVKIYDYLTHKIYKVDGKSPTKMTIELVIQTFGGGGNLSPVYRCCDYFIKRKRNIFKKDEILLYNNDNELV